MLKIDPAKLAELRRHNRIYQRHLGNARSIMLDTVAYFNRKKVGGDTIHRAIAASTFLLHGADCIAADSEDGEGRESLLDLCFEWTTDRFFGARLWDHLPKIKDIYDMLVVSHHEKENPLDLDSHRLYYVPYVFPVLVWFVAFGDIHRCLMWPGKFCFHVRDIGCRGQRGARLSGLEKNKWMPKYGDCRDIGYVGSLDPLIGFALKKPVIGHAIETAPDLKTFLGDVRFLHRIGRSMGVIE